MSKLLTAVLLAVTLCAACEACLRVVCEITTAMAGVGR